MTGLIIVKRVDWRKRAPRAPIAPFTWDSVLSTYAGIDGELWPTEVFGVSESPSGLLSRKHLQDVLNWWRTTPDSARCDLLWCDSVPSQTQEQPAPDGFEFVGLDVGFEIDEYTVYGYSAVYQDVVFGQLKELTSFARFLNQQLLFPDAETAERFLRVRRNLSDTKVDLEREADLGELLTLVVYRCSTRG